MKKILILGALLIGGVLVNKANAQQYDDQQQYESNTPYDPNVNIDAQPEWGPGGYDNAQYYYLPDIEVYYCIPTRSFTWFENGRWINSPYLPGRYSNYDLYSGYKVVINERNPWMHFYNHRSVYAPYRYRHDQLVIRDYRSRNYGGVYYNNRGWQHGWNNNRGRVYGRTEPGRNYGGRTDYGHGNSYGRDNGHGRNDDHGRGNGGVRDHGRRY